MGGSGPIGVTGAAAGDITGVTDLYNAAFDDQMGAYDRFRSGVSGSAKLIGTVLGVRAATGRFKAWRAELNGTVVETPSGTAIKPAAGEPAPATAVEPVLAVPPAPAPNTATAAKATSKRLAYMGKTPGRASRTGREVIERMKQEGTVIEA